MFRRPVTVGGKEAEPDKRTAPEALKPTRSGEREKASSPLPGSKRMSLWRIALLSIVISVVISSPLFYLLYTRLGLGAPFPSQPFLEASSPILPETALEIVAELPIPPGNIAVSSRGRLFFNYHPEYHPPVKVLEIRNRAVVPFPSVAFQAHYITVLSMRVDQQDRLWLLDFANHGMSGVPRLFGFDLRKQDQLIANHSFPAEVAGFGSMLNDFQVDPKGEMMYIADTSMIASAPGIVVLDLRTLSSRRLLSGHASMFGTSTFLKVAHESIGFGPLGMKINVDSIALDRQGRWLYFGALTGHRLYAIGTEAMQAYLVNNNTKALEGAVKVVCTEKPATDGLSMDSAGNIWMTAIEHSALAIAMPTANKDGPPIFSVMKAVQSDKYLRWPDGLSFGPEGLYITSSVLHRRMLQANMSEAAPFHITRLPLKALKNKELYRGRKYVSTPAGQ